MSPTADIPRVFIGSETFLFYCSPIWTPHRAFFFLFTKCLKTLVKFWRQNGVNIVLYLDDELGIGSSLRDSSQNSVFVRQSLIDAGFLINEDKSIFTPVQSLEWLGIVWNSLDYSLSIPDWRIVDIVDALTYLLSRLPFITAHLLAQVTDRIISMSPVIALSSKSSDRKCFVNIRAIIKRYF